MYRNIVMINDQKRDLKTLSEEERKRLADQWNRQSAESVNYKEVPKPA